jgi:hypothetical protein
MNPIEHPQTIMLIHDEMIRRELERGRRAQLRRDDRPGPSGGGRIRNALSRGLIALARRISPDETVDAGLPAAARHG